MIIIKISNSKNQKEVSEQEAMPTDSNKMQNIEIESADSLLSLFMLIDEYFTHFDEYIFRGQADINWKLETSLARAINKRFPSGIDPDYDWKINLTRFKKNIRGRISNFAIKESDDELWALGQHYGLNTPLLDWTRSPYVALFFSLIGDCQSGMRSLWALCDNAISVMYNASTDVPFEGRIRIIDPTGGFNNRLVAQNGLFLHIPPNKSLENELATFNYTDGVAMYKIQFPDEISNDLRAALDRRNINYSTLYPDIEGAARATNSIFELEPYLDEKREQVWSKANTKAVV